MRKPVVLITGANGELGHGLIETLNGEGHDGLLGLDLMPLDPEIARRCRETFVGDILDRDLMERIVSQYEVREIYHLAALLSTRAEFTPDTAHRVNVEGTLNLLQVALEQSSWRGDPVKFLFPSSIAVYGLPDLETKRTAGPIPEHEWTSPTTMYGCNKLYCENLGRYYARFYRQLAEAEDSRTVDFRAIRFPGLISATTVPTGGTSDYGPEMIHAAARGEPYACFVRPDTVIPFMAMPDAVTAFLQLARAPLAALSRCVYNITAFSLSAEEFRKRVLGSFPDAEISFQPHLKRQAIVDTWPAEVDDAQAREDWGFAPAYGLERAFDEYLFPTIKGRYRRS
jgi:nucleoside-diphosphate-sugar epimerase